MFNPSPLMDLPNSHSIVLLVPVVLLLILLAITKPSAHAATANIPSSSTDLQALISFKSLLSDPQQALASWNSSSLHYCQWTGVTCSSNNSGRVVALDLDSLALHGTISPYIGNLTFLTRVHLPNNSLQGHIPRELGNLKQLQHLYLRMNSLGGAIPDALSQCPHLQNVSLRDNMLEGPMPATLSRCLNLQILSLSNNNLSGEIPEEFASLPKLSNLYLNNNKLTGRIPALLGISSELVNVYLSSNQLTGGIPSSLGESSSLAYLVLSGNKLSGGIPASLWNISSLVYLDLGDNFLTGPIPPFRRNLSNLQFVNLADNYLSGVIPSSLGSQYSIQYLCLYNNRLEGSIPASLADIPNLAYLDLSINSLSEQVPVSLYNITPLSYLGLGDNKLTGNIPLDIGHTLPNIQSLVLQSNLFDGPIPTSLLNATVLEELHLSNNSFTGPIPSDFGLLKNLRRLELGWNLLEIKDWNFFSSLSSCSQLERLILEDNQIEGILPASVGNLSKTLDRLQLGKNKFHGPIPAEIGNLVGLSVLYLDQTLFTGRIPETIGDLPNLHILYLPSNNLSGPIPASIGSLAQLNELYMQDNMLSADIPATFGNLRHLDILNLSHNSLSGSIPEELVSISSLSRGLDLSHNSLNSSLPLKVGSLSNLLSFSVSDNQLTGEIPATLGDCVVLESLHMEGNYFTGKIPESFENLKSIQELDLSRNSLSGQIPEFLEKLSSLQHLNLSFNELEGEVPPGGPFSNASEVSLVGNRRLCGGNPILHLPPCDSKSSSKPISLKLKIVIPVAVIILILSLTGALCYRRRVAGEPVSGLKDEQKLVSYLDISRATNGFSHEKLVGTGSFGSVYKANMDLYKDVLVIKVFNLEQIGGLKSFIAECEALRNIRHRNLIKIITACSSADSMGNDFKALVFEYMPNGSLEEWLHSCSDEHSNMKKLNLNQMLNIAIDVASAMCYLHHGCDVPLVHCDLKPSNILLDNDMVPHVGDFGLARFLTTSLTARSKNSTSLMGMKGSIGYIAPEYAMGNPISTQGDVYSYGVLLLEMLTGKRPTDGMFKDGLNLHKYVELALLDESWRILDPALFEEAAEEVENAMVIRSVANAWVKKERSCIASLAGVGLLCSKESPKERITMEDAAAQLKAIKEEMYSKVESDVNVGETITISAMS